MGKKGKVPKASAGGGIPAASPVGGPGETSGADNAGARGGDEDPGLLVRWQKNSVVYIAVMCFIVVCLAGTVLSFPSLPRLLSYWSWLLLTLFSVTLVVCRCRSYFSGSDKAEEVSAWVIFWGLLMIHGLAWLSCVFVFWRGVPPSAMWHAFGEHAGLHLNFTSLGTVPLLLLPPILLLAFMVYERSYLVLIYHDFFLASGKYKSLGFQLVSPLMPLALWAALLRPPLFTDLTEWPPVWELMGVCTAVNGPLLAYVLWTTRDLYGPAHWLPEGGCAVWHAPPQFMYYRRADGGVYGGAPPH